MNTPQTIFKNKWLVSYATKEFEYPEILDTMYSLQQKLETLPSYPPNKYVVFNKSFTENTIYHEPSCPPLPGPATVILMRNTDTDSLMEKSVSNDTKQQHLDRIPRFPVIGKNNGTNGIDGINAIHLALPVNMNDKRWETIHLTSSSIFLGSMLSSAGYKVSTGKITLPVTDASLKLPQVDMIGFTLFEDLYKDTSLLLEKINTRESSQISMQKSSTILAAGGPMVTLNPMQTARHLPQLNLLVRGEGEWVFPGIVDAINAGDYNQLLNWKGFLLQLPGTVVVSDLDDINRPKDFASFLFNLDFLRPNDLENGLEINLSRGCKRGCIFCSRVQGRGIRELPSRVVEQLLEEFDSRLRFFNVASPHCRSININDDDILQDVDYARAVFDLVKKYGYGLWGIQTSVNSFYGEKGNIREDVLELVSDGSLYMEGKPLVWCGTDAFLRERGRKLGKLIPTEDRLFRLVEAFENRGVNNYHYWISSDDDTNWDEFFREVLLIFRLKIGFNRFGLIAHSPFLVPYSSARLYGELVAKGKTGQIRYRSESSHGRLSLGQGFRFPLVERVETTYEYLNRLLLNEGMSGRRGFFDYLKTGDYLNMFMVMYDFLKMERLAAGAEAEQLRQTEQQLEELISTLI